jgi:hypothetical protein
MEMYLWFSLPIMNVGNGGETAEIDVDTRGDEHVACRDDKDDRRVGRVVDREPDVYWDVVARISIRDGDQAMQAEEDLSAAVVEGVYRSAGTQSTCGGVREGGGDMVVYLCAVVIYACVIFEPFEGRGGHVVSRADSGSEL